MEPLATIVITTRNRKEELRDALASCLLQDVPLNILVVDDASTDGTAELVRSEFPSVRLVSKPRMSGYIASRNLAAEMVKTPYIISIDDDAVFSEASIVRDAIAGFCDNRIGVVAIPFINVKEGPRVMQIAPDDADIYVSSVFIGTAHAIRAELFRQLGGYRVFFVSQFEEHDFCLRMLEFGHYVRLGRTKPIHHFQSPKRLRGQIVFFGERNQILLTVLNFPLWFIPRLLAGSIVRGIRNGRKHGFMLSAMGGLVRGFVDSIRFISDRRAISPATVLRLKAMQGAASPLTLSALEKL
jgi:GT2 family glycosyltransferase